MHTPKTLVIILNHGCPYWSSHRSGTPVPEKRRKKDHIGPLPDITLIDFQGNPRQTIVVNPAHKNLLEKLQHLTTKSGTGLKP